MTTAISVEGLSKHYTLGHNQGPGYTTLRESIMRVAGTSCNRLGRWLSRGPDEPRAEDASELWALRDVGFDIRPGEAVGIVGRNGAGKSTLLKVLSRITAPTEGRIAIRGRLGSLLEVGTGFHPELTGRENIFLNGAIIGMGRREIASKFDDIVEFSELGRFIDTPVKRYSSGMYVRLAFAVAAHMEHEILLIDEVLSVGDLAFQRKCMEHMKRLLARNATILVVSHNMFAIKAMCERCLFLSQGRLTHDASTEEIVKIYDDQARLDMSGWARGAVGNDPAQCPIHITEFELLDSSGRPCNLFRVGDRMTIRLHYECREPIHNPTFSVGLLRSDGVSSCNYNNTTDGVALGEVSGRGVIELSPPPIKLVAEMYAVHVLIWDSRFQHLYCAQEATSFHVTDPVLSTEFGVFHESAAWKRLV